MDMVKSRENLIGAYAFLIGIVLAIITGIFTKSPEQASPYFYSVLVIIGLIVGFAKRSDDSSNVFLIASLALIIVGSLGTEPIKFISQSNYVVNPLRNILTFLVILFVPVTIIVALKTVFSITKV